MLDLAPAGGKGAEESLGGAVELGHAAADRPEADPEALAQAMAEHGLVDEPGGAGVGVEESGVGCGPGAVAPPRHVGHQHVGVELGVPRSRGPVHEGGRHETVGADVTGAVAPPAQPQGVALEVAEGVGHGFLVGDTDGG